MAHSGVILYMQTVPALGDGWRELSHPCPVKLFNGKLGAIPQGFRWNGHSSGILSPIWPRWNHPRASCTHDYLCSIARTPEERLFADRLFRELVGTTSWGVTKWIGYAGVRAGAMLGIGRNY